MVLQRAAVLPSDFSFSFDLRWHGLPRISRVALFRPRLSTFANAPPSLLQLRSTGVPFLLPQVLSDFLRVYLRATMSTSSLTSNRIISLLFLLLKTLLIGKHFYNLSHRWIWPTDNRGIIANLFITLHLILLFMFKYLTTSWDYTISTAKNCDYRWYFIDNFRYDNTNLITKINFIRILIIHTHN